MELIEVMPLVGESFWWKSYYSRTSKMEVIGCNRMSQGGVLRDYQGNLGTVYLFLGLIMKSVHAIQIARIARVVAKACRTILYNAATDGRRLFFRMRIIPPI